VEILQDFPARRSSQDKVSEPTDKSHGLVPQTLALCSRVASFAKEKETGAKDERES